MAKKAIYKLRIDAGRNGDLNGVFLTTRERIEKLVESEAVVYFGEVLGKHSEVFCKIGDNMIEFVSDNEEVVRLFEEHNLSNGFNPFDYMVHEYELNDEYLEDINVSDLVDKLLNQR